MATVYLAHGVRHNRKVAVTSRHQARAGVLLIGAIAAGAVLSFDRTSPPHVVGKALRDPIVGRVDFARDGAGVYFRSHDAMGRASLWYEPLTGGRPTLLVRFDDLAPQSYRSNFAVAAGKFFFAINDRQSDVWVAELTTR